jgi:hypothetical protein
MIVQVLHTNSGARHDKSRNHIRRKHQGPRNESVVMMRSWIKTLAMLHASVIVLVFSLSAFMSSVVLHE